MSYGVKWRLEYMDELSRDKRIDILKKDYTGDIQTVTGATHSPVHISMQNQGDERFETMKGTEIEVKLFSEVQFGGTFSNFSDDTFYVTSLSGTGTSIIYKCQSDAGSITVLQSYDLGTDYLEDERSGCVVLRNGNVVVYSYPNNSSCKLSLFDSDLTLITQKTETFSSGNDINKIFSDYDNSIYILAYSSGIGIRKLDSNLDVVYTSIIPSTDNNHFFRGGNVTKNLFVLLHRRFSGNTNVSFINKETGVYDGGFTADYGVTVDNTKVINYTNGNFLISGDNFSSVNNSIICDEHGTILEGPFSINLVDSLSLGDTADIIADGTYVFNRSGAGSGDSRVVHVDTDFSEIWSSADFGLEAIKNIHRTTDPNILFVLTRSLGANTGSIFKIDLTNQTVALEASIGANSPPILPSSGYAFAMPVTNWQLQDNGTEIDFSEIAEGSDTDYKIEVYEDDGL